MLRNWWNGRSGRSLTRPALGAVIAAVLLVLGALVVRTAPRAESSLALADGAAWLPSTVIGGVSLLDGSSGSIAASLGISDAGDELKVVEWGSDAIVVNETTGTVGRLDATTWTVATGLVRFGDVNAPLDVVVGPSSGWVVKPGVAAAIDPTTLEQRQPIPIGAAFNDGVVGDDGSLIVSGAAATDPVRRLSVNGDSEEIEGIDGPVALQKLGPATVGVDLDDQRVWIDGEGVVCDRLEFPADASLHVGGQGDRLLVVADSGGMMMWDPTERGCPSSSDFLTVDEGEFGEPAVTEGWAVLPDLGRSEVIVVDLVGNEVIARQPVEGIASGTRFDVVAENGAVWFNDPSSSAAGLVRPDGNIIPVAKYDSGSDSGFVAAPIDEPGDEGREVEVAGERQEREPEPIPNEPEPAREEDDAEQPLEDETTEDPTPPVAPPDDGDDDTTNPPVGPPVDPPVEEPDPDDGGDEEDEDEGETPIIEVQLAATALQAATGEPVTFQAVPIHGNPLHFDFSTNPNTADVQPFEKFGFITYTFPAPGTYFVSVDACDADDNCDTSTISVEIVAGVVQRKAAIANPGVVSAGQPVTMRHANQGDNITSMLWSFGPGATPSSSAEAEPTVTWDSAGDKTVELTIFGPSSCGPDVCTADEVALDTATRTVTVVAGQAPYDISIGGPTTVDVGEAVTYVASTASPNGLPDPHWNVGGAAAVTPRESEIDVTWNVAGTYEITLNTDNGSAQGAGSLTVTVVEPAPVTPAQITISCSPTSLEEREFAQCSIDSTDNIDPSGPSGWVTSYPDPSKGTFNGSGITYDGVGVVNVSYFGTHAVSGDRIDSNTVAINFTASTAPPTEAAPLPAIAGSTNLEVGETGSWSVTNSGGPVDSYSWGTNVGNPSVAADQLSATKSWAAAGTYTVTVTATGPGGTNSDSIQVVVTDPAPTAPPPVIACNASSAETGFWVQCPLQGDPSLYTNYNWSIGWPDPSLANSWAASAWEMHVGYLGTGNVTLTLTATHVATGLSVTSNTETVTYTAPPSDPAPQLTLNGPTALDTGQAGNFSYSNSGGTITSDSWSADGQGGGSGANYSATWNTAGTYNVTVNASGPGGSDSKTITVTVSDPAPPPPADSPFGVSCGASSAPGDTNVLCTLQGSASNFTGLTWSVNIGSSWLNGGNPAENWVSGPIGSTMTVTLTGTDIGTGNFRSDSFVINWT